MGAEYWQRDFGLTNQEASCCHILLLVCTVLHEYPMRADMTDSVLMYVFFYVWNCKSKPVDGLKSYSEEPLSTKKDKSNSKSYL